MQAIKHAKKKEEIKINNNTTFSSKTQTAEYLFAAELRR